MRSGGQVARELRRQGDQACLTEFHRIGRLVRKAMAAFGATAVTARAATGDEKTWVGEVEKHGRHYD